MDRILQLGRPAADKALVHSSEQASRVGRLSGLVRQNLDFAAPLAALGIMNWIGTLGAPALWSLPLLLIALSPRLPFLAVAAAQTGLILFLLIATLRLCVADPFNYVMGRRHGQRMANGLAARIRWRPRRLLRRIPAELMAMARPEHRAHHLFCSAWVLVRPNARVMAWAGAIGLSARRTAVLDVTGTAAYVVMLYLGVGVLV